MERKGKVDWLKWIMLILVVLCLVAVIFIYRYAKSEGFECLKDPLKYAEAHNETLINPTGVNPYIPIGNISLQNVTFKK